VTSSDLDLDSQSFIKSTSIILLCADRVDLIVIKTNLDLNLAMLAQLEFATTRTENYDILESARLKYKNRNYHGAIAEYTLAIELNPDDALAYACRGVVHYRMSDIIGAMTDYTRAIDLDPKLAIAYYRRGFIHYLTKEYLLAIDDYNMAIELNPNDALAYSNRSYAYRKLYGEMEAIIDLRRAAKLFKEQGRLDKYHKTMTAINESIGGDSWGSGML
jgi:tetratricopeptide (TPR) repeat protein